MSRCRSNGDRSGRWRVARPTRRSSPLVGSIALFTCIAALASAPAALAVTSFSWSGAAGGFAWSNPADWAGGSAPTTPAGTLTFGDLGACGACYISVNDIGAFNVGTLAIDDSSPYVLVAENPGSDAITLSPSSGDGIAATASQAGGGQYSPDTTCR
jgi:hypothetical protein